jgi:FdhD protein
VPVKTWCQDQPTGTVDDSIAAEVPLALTYNRVSHVVMMATPVDLEDFAVGFSITEGLIGGLDDLKGIRIIPRQGGIELAMTISEDWFDRLATQRRNMAGRTGCGAAQSCCGCPGHFGQSFCLAKGHITAGSASADPG